MQTKDSFFKILCLFFVALGVFSRVWLFVSNPDLWLDDAMLSASVWLSSWKDIFAGHLLYDNQSAPLGFILSVKALAAVFGDSEYVLRFLPLIAGIALFPLAYSFAEREFGIKATAVFLFFLACSDPLLVYSIQFKQYSLEAFFALAFLNAYSLYRKDILETSIVPWKLFLLAFAGTQFGNTAFFILFGILVAILVENMSNLILLLKKNWHKFLLFVVYAGLYYVLWLSQVDAVKSGFMDFGWKPYFFPDLKYLDKWILNYLVCILSYFVDFTPNLNVNASVFVLCFFGGIYFLFKQKKYLGIAIISIVVLMWILYFLQIYPLGVSLDKSKAMRVVGIRTSIYFIPIVLLAVSIFVAKIFELRMNKYFLATLGLIMLIFAIHSTGIRIGKGAWYLEIEKYVDIMKSDDKWQNCNVVMTEAAGAVYSYYGHRNNIIAEEWILPTNNNIYFPKNTENRFILPNDIDIKFVFNMLEETDKKCTIFLVSYNTPLDVKYSNDIFNYVVQNYRGKIKGFDGNLSGAVFIDMED